MTRLNKIIEAELQATGLPWEAERGSRHIKLRLAGKFVGILPLKGDGSSGRGARANANVVSQIRRAAREHCMALAA